MTAESDNWHRLNNCYYSKIKISSKKLPGLIAVKCFGGKTALQTNTNKLYLLDAGFNSMAELNYNIVTFGFLDPHLCIVCNNGIYYVDGSANVVKQTSFNVFKAWISSGYLVTLSSEGDLTVFGNGNKININGTFKEIKTVSILPSSDMLNFDLFCISQNKFGKLVNSDNEFGIQEYLSEKAPFLFLKISPNNEFIALLSSTTLYVLQSDTLAVLLEFNTKSRIVPSNIEWCGNDSILLLWEEVLLVVGPYGDWIKFSVIDSVLEGAEDGCFIFSKNNGIEWLEKVNDKLAGVFSSGSTCYSALLYDSFLAFEQRDAKCNEALKSLKDNLPSAIRDLLEAALYTYDVETQKSLLLAAHFGLGYLSTNSSEFGMRMNSICKELRVLGDYKKNIGWITYNQFQSLGSTGVISNLLEKRKHFMALKVAEHLGVSKKAIIEDWVGLKIKVSKQDDESLAKEIFKKLDSIDRVSLADVAKVAYKEGRPILASILLEAEPRISEQIPLLLQMNEFNQALAKSVEVGDCDLVYTSLLYLKRKMALPTFFKLISHYPVAVKLLELYAKERDVQMLKDFYFQEDKKYQQGKLIYLKEASETPDLKEKKALFKQSLKYMGENAFASKVIDQHVKLLKFQEDLELELQEDFVNISVYDTLYKIFLKPASAHQWANQIIKELRVNEKLVWHLKIRAFAHNNDWESLEKLSRSKRSPIGYKAFVEACISHRANLEAKKYIPKLPDPDTKFNFYLKINAIRECIELATANKNVDMLKRIRSQSKNVSIQQELDVMIKKIKE